MCAKGTSLGNDSFATNLVNTSFSESVLPKAKKRKKNFTQSNEAA